MRCDTGVRALSLRGRESDFVDATAVECYTYEFLSPHFSDPVHHIMDAMLVQLGGLLLAAVPTALLLLLVYALYTALVHKPLQKVLAERRAKTEGAVEKARADIAAAEARTAEYEERLRDARLLVFKRQEARRKEALDVRTKALGEARAKAQEQIKQARTAIADDANAAKAGLEGEAGRLASEIVQAVLRPAGAR
jgi:F-type H+-transporting ATPase subunit b